MKSMKILMAALSLLALFLMSACAHNNYTSRIEILGKYQDTSKLEEKANDMKWADASKINVYVGTFPEGITLENGAITVSPDSNFELIGKVYTAEDVPSPIWFSTHPEDEGWKNAYCNAQVPLTWVTVMMWWVVPVHYPCWPAETNSPSRISDRKMRIINTLKKATKAAGGDTLIITELGSTQFVAGTKVMSTLEMTGAEGYALKLRKAKKEKKAIKAKKAKKSKKAKKVKKDDKAI